MQRISQLGLRAQAQLLVDQPTGEVGENLKYSGSINIGVIQKTLHLTKGSSHFLSFAEWWVVRHRRFTCALVCTYT